MDNIEKIRQLSTVRGFVQAYFAKLKDATTQPEAYEMVETEHLEIFNRRKYSNYDSFRVVKNRVIKG